MDKQFVLSFRIVQHNFATLAKPGNRNLSPGVFNQIYCVSDVLPDRPDAETFFK